MRKTRHADHAYSDMACSRKSLIRGNRETRDPPMTRHGNRAYLCALPQSLVRDRGASLPL